MSVKVVQTAAAVLALAAVALPAQAKTAEKIKKQMVSEIPTCTKKLGTIAIVEPDNNWWQAQGFGSPEAILKVFVMKSGCFGLVDRNKGLASRNIERALADQGELQGGSNIGRAQVKAADYFIVPDLVAKNENAGGNKIGGLVGGMLGGRTLGALAGGLSFSKKEANVTLTLVNARTTEQERLVEGYFRKTDMGFGGGAGAGSLFGAFGGLAGGGYSNTDVGQVIVLAYLQAYHDLVKQLGGLPEDASAAAPKAQ